MKTTPFGFIVLLVALAILLSVVNAEGQEMQPVITFKAESFFSVINTVITGNGKLVYGGSSLNYEGKELVVANSSNTIELGSVTGGVITSTDLLVVKAASISLEFHTLAVFDLNNLNGPVNFRGHSVFRQNWTLDFEMSSGFGKFFHVDEQNNKMIVYSEDTIFVYDFLGDGTPLQEISGEGLVNLAGSGQYFAVANGTGAILYGYNGTEYTRKATYEKRKDGQAINTAFGENMTLSVAGNGSILLAASNFPVPETEFFVINPNTFRAERTTILGLEPRFSTGEYVVVIDYYEEESSPAKIFHVPSASLFAEIILPQREKPVGWKVCAEMRGSNLVVYILDGLDYSSFISKYETAIIPVVGLSQKASKNTGEPTWKGGNFGVEGCPYSMPGDYRVLYATAFPGYVVDEMIINGKHVKAAEKERAPVGGHFLRVQINEPTTITGSFRKANATEKSKAVLFKGFSVRFPWYLLGSRTEEALNDVSLLPGKYIIKAFRPSSGRDEYIISKKGKVSVKNGTY